MKPNSQSSIIQNWPLSQPNKLSVQESIAYPYSLVLESNWKLWNTDVCLSMDELQKLSKENQTQQVILDCIDLDRKDRFVDTESRVTLSWTLKPVRHEWKISQVQLMRLKKWQKYSRSEQWKWWCCFMNLFKVIKLAWWIIHAVSAIVKLWQEDNDESEPFLGFRLV